LEKKKRGKSWRRTHFVGGKSPGPKGLIFAKLPESIGRDKAGARTSRGNGTSYKQREHQSAAKNRGLQACQGA